MLIKKKQLEKIQKGKPNELASINAGLNLELDLEKEFSGDRKKFIEEAKNQGKDEARREFEAEKKSLHREIDHKRKTLEEHEKKIKEQESALDQREKTLLKEAQEIEKCREEAFSLLEKREKELLDQIASINELKSELVFESKEMFIDLVIKLTEKLLRKKIKENPTTIEFMIEEALSEMSIDPDQATKLSLRVNPEDKDAATALAEELYKKTNSKLDIRVAEDESISLGSCFLEGSSGSIDLNFSSQLQFFKEKMMR